MQKLAIVAALALSACASTPDGKPVMVMSNTHAIVVSEAEIGLTGGKGRGGMSGGLGIKLTFGGGKPVWGMR